MGSGSFYIPKKNNFKDYDAVTWIQQHPEDIPLAKENIKARDRGFADDDVRQLMAAICLRACIDYKRSCNKYAVNTKYGQRTLNDCREFFKSDIFQWFVNGMSVKEIEERIRATPDDAIATIWKRMELTKAPKKID